MKKQYRMPMTPWGKRCKAIMIESGMTLSDLAQKIGYSYTYTSMIINGRVFPAENVVSSINNVLGISKEEFATLNSNFLIEAAK